MSGVLVIGELLRAAAAVDGAPVPADRIKEDVIDGGAYPAIAVSTVSQVDRQRFTGTKWHARERVQVTIMANSPRERREVLNWVRETCRYRQGDFAGVTDVSILTDGVGPSIESINPNYFMTTQDLSVAFNEA
jgi:hypothetical protein